MSAQISAYISDQTKERFEAYSSEHGVKKGFLIENALEHYLNALEAIPTQFIDRQKLILSDASFDAALQAQEHQPTEALKKLMQDG